MLGLWQLAALGWAVPAEAQLVVKLSPKTVSEFKRYADDVEGQMNARWAGKKAFLSIEEQPQTRNGVLGGEIFIKQQNGGQPVSITDGLIHDWSGAIFMPGSTAKQVVAVLEDFNNHEKIYPEVSQSKTLSREGENVTGSWRLEQKSGLTIILDVSEHASFSQIVTGKWKGVARSDEIRETDTSWFARGKKYSADEGHGFLWRLYAYWTLEEANGGVIAECRTLSLSRDIPKSLAWAVAPFVDKQPRQSLTSTLENTRKAIAR